MTIIRSERKKKNQLLYHSTFSKICKPVCVSHSTHWLLLSLFFLQGWRRKLGSCTELHLQPQLLFSYANTCNHFPFTATKTKHIFYRKIATIQVQNIYYVSVVRSRIHGVRLESGLCVGFTAAGRGHLLEPLKVSRGNPFPWRISQIFLIKKIFPRCAHKGLFILSHTISWDGSQAFERRDWWGQVLC